MSDDPERRDPEAEARFHRHIDALIWDAMAERHDPATAEMMFGPRPDDDASMS